MKYVTANIENIKDAAEIIMSGGLVAFPTETVYGLGANGLDPVAAAKIFEAKNRPSFNPLILHINSTEMLSEIASFDDERIRDLINQFWPGPLTLVLKKKNTVPQIVTAEHSTVAVRMPANSIALKLIELANTPVAAPSANAFGFLSPTKAEHVRKQLGNKIDMILDGGSTDVGVESTIVQFHNGKFFLLRPGGLPTENIEAFTGKLIRKSDENNPNSPGQLKYHYSTSVPIKFLKENDFGKISKNDAVLFFREDKSEVNCKIKRVLSPNGDLRVAAANLFKYLHELEESGASVIYVQPIPEEGLGMAIMDRLIKATNKYR